MKHYKSESGEIFAYEADGSQDAFIKEGLVLISDDELSEIRAMQEAENAPTQGQILQAAYDKRDSLLALAGLRIAPLQDAVDLDMATEVEAAVILQWKQFRIDVNRVSAQNGFPTSIDWPELPAQ